MSILTKKHILGSIKSGAIKFTPTLDKFQIQDHAVDLRLGFTFLVPKIWHLTSRGREALDFTHFDKTSSEYFDIVELEEGQYFDLLPQEFVIASTLEKIKVPNNLAAILYPRSSTNRRGLSLDLTGMVHSGYEGQLTMPIRNNTRSQIVRLYPGERICQIVFEDLSESIEPHKGKYHGRDIIEGAAREKQTEAKLILSGKIKELKEKHKI